MAGDKSSTPNLPDPNDYWPFPDDLDEYEREFSESLEGYEILPDPNFEDTKKRVEEMARRTLAKKHPGRMTEEQRKRLPPACSHTGAARRPHPIPTPPDGMNSAKP